jgi:di/tricarboxylate transporter
MPPNQAGYQGLPLFEAVVSDSSQLVGKTLGEANFRERYQGVVLGIQRKDESLQGPIGHTPIRAGDLLFVEADSDFDERWRGSRDEFYLVAPRQDERAAPASWKAPLALSITGAMVLVAAASIAPIVTAAFAAAFLMIITGCIGGAEAREALNIQVLVVIAAALGLGHAVQTTGIARVIADAILEGTASIGPVAALAVVYLATNLLTELITNNAAAVLMLPVSLSTASSLEASPEAFAVVVAVAASASFITPIGYQTNLMVMSPGGYRFGDYTRVGWPLSLLIMSITVAVVSSVWL